MIVSAHWLRDKTGLPLPICRDIIRAASNGARIDTPDEETFFAQIGLDYIRPEDRA